MGDVSNQDGTDASKTMKTCWELTGNKSTLKGPSCTYEGANKFNKVADSMKWLQCPWRLNLDMATRRKVCVKVKVRIQRKKKNDWDNYCCPLPLPHLGIWRPHKGAVLREKLCSTLKLFKVFIIGQPLSCHHPPQIWLENITDSSFTVGNVIDLVTSGSSVWGLRYLSSIVFNLVM